MRTPIRLLLAGAGALVLAGAALAADRGHVLNVALPDGSVARIHYVGDVPPQVVMAQPAEAMPVAFMAEDPFAMFDRVALAMDRQMDAMLQQASAMTAAAPSGQISEAALRTMPQGTVSYSYTSYSSGKVGGCSQSVQVTSLGQNQAPKVVRQSAGDCTAMNRPTATPTVGRTEPAAPAPALTKASLDKPKEAPARGPVI